MKTNTSDRAVRLAELEFIAVCKQHQAAKRQAPGVKRARRMRPDFYSHYLRPVQDSGQSLPSCDDRFDSDVRLNG
jgi:hypothetical protein